MCNITLIDTENGVITPREVRELTTINCLLGNWDGFGMCLFDDHKVIKTKNDATDFWRSNYRKFTERNYYNGIYHVRKSSTYSTSWVNGVKTEDKSLSDEKSHPFCYNNVIVAHNGFLTFRHNHIDAAKFENFLVGDLIDSQKFSIVLSNNCVDGKVTLDNIKYSLNLFGGAYALAIKGIKDDFAWLVRGKDRTLYEFNIFDDKKLVGIIVNTTTTGLYLIGEFLLDFGYDYAITELKENTAYKYDLNSYELKEAGSIIQDSEFEKDKVIIAPAYNNYKSNEVTIPSNIFEDIFDVMYEMGLLISDIAILSEIIMKKPLFIMDENEFTIFKKKLDKLNDEVHKGRVEVWQELLGYKEGSVYNLYKNLQYPYMLNSKEEMKIYLDKLKSERKLKDELPIIQ